MSNKKVLISGKSHQAPTVDMIFDDKKKYTWSISSSGIAVGHLEDDYPKNQAAVDKSCRNISKVFNKGSESEKSNMLKEVEWLKSRYTSNELNKSQIARIDEVENAVFEMVKTLVCDPNLDWNMEIIGDIADAACEILSKKGYLIYYPNVTIDEDENGAISDFYNV